MENKKIKLILKLIGVVLFTIGMIMVGIAMQYGSLNEKEVKCYDRFSNEIEGEVCLDKYTKYTGNGELINDIGVTLLFVGMFFYLLSAMVIIKEDSA